MLNQQPVGQTIGDYYAKLLEEQLQAGIEHKFNETSAFKKALVGISTVDDAKHKGYAPNNHQIDQMKACIRTLANTSYADKQFCNLSADIAADQLVEEFTDAIRTLNHGWKKAHQFTFDSHALSDMAQEAMVLIRSEHSSVRKMASK